MGKCLFILLALMILLGFSFGCTGAGKEQMIKCAKCGTYFRTQEGADWFNNMGRP
jgi:hypothetical protein